MTTFPPIFHRRAAQLCRALSWAAGLLALSVHAAPTVSLSSPAANAVFATPANVTLNATATPSARTTISKVAFYRGTTLIGTDTTAPYSIVWANAAAGSYSLTAKATDSKKATTTSAAVVIVVGTPPTVSLSSPAANSLFNAGASITLAATAADSDGTVAKVNFYAGSTLIGSDTSAPYSVTWANAPAGSYSLTAKATDNKGIVSSSTAIPIVVNAAPTVSLSGPLANTVFNSPATITLTASAADSDGTLTKVDFYQGATLIGTATSAPYTVTWSNVGAGTYNLTAKATDNRGLSTTSAGVSIHVDLPPSIALSSPLANATFTAPATIPLAATAADSDGTVAKVDFYQGTILIGTTTTAPYTLNWPDVSLGSYTLTARATDNRGVVTTSSPVGITVQAGGTKIYYLHTDHLDTPRLATDEQNRIVWRNQPLSEPFGNSPPEEDPDGNGQAFVLNLRAPGQYYDRESGTHYNYFRDYDPTTGRYLQSDPIGLLGGINTYSYVGGNPLSSIDPMGLAGVRIPGLPIPLPLPSPSKPTEGSGTGSSDIDAALPGTGSSSRAGDEPTCKLVRRLPPDTAHSPCSKCWQCTYSCRSGGAMFGGGQFIVRYQIGGCVEMSSPGYVPGFQSPSECEAATANGTTNNPTQVR